MSLSDELVRIRSAKETLRTNVTAKGVETSENDSLTTLAAKVADIEQSSGDSLPDMTEATDGQVLTVTTNSETNEKEAVWEDNTIINKDGTYTLNFLKDKVENFGEKNFLINLLSNSYSDNFGKYSFSNVSKGNFIVDTNDKGYQHTTYSKIVSISSTNCIFLGYISKGSGYYSYSLKGFNSNFIGYLSAPFYRDFNVNLGNLNNVIVSTNTYSGFDLDNLNKSTVIGYYEKASTIKPTTKSFELVFVFGLDNTIHSSSTMLLGFGTTAYANYATAMGYYTTANGMYSHVQGKYNEPNTLLFADIVGNGTATDSLSNASALDWNGNLYLAGNVYVGCTDYSEDSDGNLNTENCGGTLLGGSSLPSEDDVFSEGTEVPEGVTLVLKSVRKNGQWVRYWEEEDIVLQ